MLFRNAKWFATSRSQCPMRGKNFYNCECIATHAHVTVIILRIARMKFSLNSCGALMSEALCKDRTKDERHSRARWQQYSRSSNEWRVRARRLCVCVCYTTTKLQESKCADALTVLPLRNDPLNRCNSATVNIVVTSRERYRAARGSLTHFNYVARVYTRALRAGVVNNNYK